MANNALIAAASIAKQPAWLEKVARIFGAAFAHRLADAIGKVSHYYQATKFVTTPIARFATIAYQLYNIVRALAAIKMHNSKIRNGDKIFNIIAAVSLISFAIVSLVNPAALIAMSMASAVVSSIRDIKYLAKSVVKNAALKSELFLLRQTLKSANEDNAKRIKQRISDIEAIKTLRQYKTVHRSATLGMSLLSIAAVAVVLAVGPVGWGIMGGAFVVGFAVQLGNYIHKRRHMGKETIKHAKAVKKADRKAFESHYVRFIKQQSKALLGKKSSTEKKTDSQENDAKADGKEAASGKQVVQSLSHLNIFESPNNDPVVKIDTDDLKIDDDYSQADVVRAANAA